jgi:hypothetical protein
MGAKGRRGEPRQKSWAVHIILHVLYTIQAIYHFTFSVLYNIFRETGPLGSFPVDRWRHCELLCVLPVMRPLLSPLIVYTSHSLILIPIYLTGYQPSTPSPFSYSFFAKRFATRLNI